MSRARRRFLLLTATAAIGAGAGGAWAWARWVSPSDRALRFASLDEALAELDRLGAATPLTADVAFTWGQTLEHLAQSIEYSLLGYPEAKPALFQATAGQAAYRAFTLLGRMQHDLSAPIPGAPPLPADADPDRAAQRLRQAVADFQRWKGPLAPHFAYGSLDHGAYARAHALHLADHFSAFTVASGA